MRRLSKLTPFVPRTCRFSNIPWDYNASITIIFRSSLSGTFVQTLPELASYTAQLSIDAVSAPRKVWIPARLRRQQPRSSGAVWKARWPPCAEATASEFWSCVKVEGAALGSPSLIVLTVSVDTKQQQQKKNSVLWLNNWFWFTDLLIREFEIRAVFFLLFFYYFFFRIKKKRLNDETLQNTQVLMPKQTRIHFRQQQQEGDTILFESRSHFLQPLGLFQYFLWSFPSNGKITPKVGKKWGWGGGGNEMESLWEKGRNRCANDGARNCVPSQLGSGTAKSPRRVFAHVWPLPKKRSHPPPPPPPTPLSTLHPPRQTLPGRHFAFLGPSANKSAQHLRLELHKKNARRCADVTRWEEWGEGEAAVHPGNRRAGTHSV